MAFSKKFNITSRVKLIIFIFNIQQAKLILLVHQNMAIKQSVIDY